MFSLSELDAAQALIQGVVPRTPTYEWPLLSRRLGHEVWVKHENLTPTGAFKVRGGLVYLDDIIRSGKAAPGLVTATRGNHGQSIPYAARRHDVPVTVFVPEGNSPDKNRAMLAWGADLVTVGQDFDEARDAADQRARETGQRFAPSFDRRLVCGVATYAREFFEDAPPLDTVYVPIGMGSGICGLIRTRDLLGLPTEIVGVVSTEAPAYALSFAAGEVVTTDSAQTFADGMACRQPVAEALEIIRAGAARVVQVTDDDVAEAMRAYFDDAHQLTEGAGAAALAGAMQERERNAGKRIGTIICGGNVDRAIFAEVLAGRTPKPMTSARR